MYSTPSPCNNTIILWPVVMKWPSIAWSTFFSLISCHTPHTACIPAIPNLSPPFLPPNLFPHRTFTRKALPKLLSIYENFSSAFQVSHHQPPFPPLSTGRVDALTLMCSLYGRTHSLSHKSSLHLMSAFYLRGTVLYTQLLNWSQQDYDTDTTLPPFYR